MARRSTFGRAERMTRASEIRGLWRDGRKIEGAGMAVYVRPQSAGAAAAVSRLGVSVPKKIGGAVRRNRVKRLVREAWRTGRAKMAAPADVLVVVRGGSARWKGLQDASGALTAALFRAGLLKRA